jgi:hypothetical protein
VPSTLGPLHLDWIRFLLDPDLERNAPSPAPARFDALLAELATHAARFGAPGSPEGEFGLHLVAMRWIHRALSELVVGWVADWKLRPRNDSPALPLIRDLHAQLAEELKRGGAAASDLREEIQQLRIAAIAGFCENAERRLLRGKLVPQSPRELFEYARKHLFEKRSFPNGGFRFGAYVELLLDRVNVADLSGHESLAADDLSDTIDDAKGRDEAPRALARPEPAESEYPSAEQAAAFLAFAELEYTRLPASARKSRVGFAATQWLIHCHWRCMAHDPRTPCSTLTATQVARAQAESGKPHEAAAAALVAAWSQARSTLGHPSDRERVRAELSCMGEDFTLRSPYRFGAVLVCSVAERREAAWPSTEAEAKQLRNDSQQNYMRFAKAFVAELAERCPPELQRVAPFFTAIED